MSTTPLVTRSEDVMWGTPVFTGTRVPVQTLFDYLEGGHPLEDFLDDFPTVSRDHALAVLEWAKRVVLERAVAQGRFLKLLLDECLPRKLKREFSAHGHEVHTVPDMGWSSWQNGTLLTAAAHAGFAVLVTMDKNMPHQQILTRYALAIVAFRARSNDVNDLLPLVPDVLAVLPTIQPGEFRRVGGGSGGSC